MSEEFLGEMIHFLKQIGSYVAAAEVAFKYKDEDLLIEIS